MGGRADVGTVGHAGARSGARQGAETAWAALARAAEERGRGDLVALELPVRLAGVAVEAARASAARRGADARAVGLGLLFGAARVLRLSGMGEADWAYHAELMFRVCAAPEEVAQRRSGQRGQGGART